MKDNGRYDADTMTTQTTSRPGAPGVAKLSPYARPEPAFKRGLVD